LAGLPIAPKFVRQHGSGGFYVTLPHSVIDGFAAMRGSGESYSDVIIRVAKGDNVGNSAGNRRALVEITDSANPVITVRHN